MPRSALSHDHVDPLVTEMGEHDSIIKGGMLEGQQVDPIIGEDVPTSHAFFVESSRGMRTVPPMHEAVSTHVHNLSVPRSENVEQGPPSCCIDAMDSAGGAATELSQQGLGGLRSWKRHARVTKTTGAVTLVGQPVVKKRNAVRNLKGKQGVAAVKKSRKSDAESYQTSPIPAEAAQQPRRAL
jgi:hypothetical protein